MRLILSRNVQFNSRLGASPGNESAQLTTQCLSQELIYINTDAASKNMSSNQLMTPTKPNSIFDSTHRKSSEAISTPLHPACCAMPLAGGGGGGGRAVPPVGGPAVLDRVWVGRCESCPTYYTVSTRTDACRLDSALLMVRAAAFRMWFGWWLEL